MPRKPTTPWKHNVQAQRRADAEARQLKYDALSIDEKLAKAWGSRERNKLLKLKKAGTK